MSNAADLCAVCGRELGTERIERHHLIPKTFKGKVLVDIHQICHRKIHATFSERELLRYYHTAERILESEQMRDFVAWVASKPLNFYVSSADSKERKRKRR